MTTRHDEVEFETFVRAIRRWLRREAYEICGDWHEADDYVQIALCRVFERWSHLDRHAELGAYARRVMFRSFLSERRKLRWRYEVPTPVVPDVALASPSHTAVDDRITLLPALRRLGPHQQAVLTLRFLHGLSIGQTAQALGCAPGTVTSQTVRALQVLRRHLQA